MGKAVVLTTLIFGDDNGGDDAAGGGKESVTKKKKMTPLDHLQNRLDRAGIPLDVRSVRVRVRACACAAGWMDGRVSAGIRTWCATGWRALYFAGATWRKVWCSLMHSLSVR